MKGEDAHPFLDVGLLEDAACEARVEVRVQGRDEVEDGLVVALGELLGAAFPVPAVARELGLPAGEERLHGSLRGREVAVVVLELEPDRDLVEVALAAVRGMVLGVGMVRFLEVLDDVGEADAVDEEELVLPLERGNAHARGKPVGDPPAQRGVLHAAVARLREQPLAHAVQQVVFRGARRDVARAAVVGAALVAEDHLVDHAGVAIDDRAAAVRVVERVAARGAAVGAGTPEPRLRKA